MTTEQQNAEAELAHRLLTGITFDNPSGEYEFSIGWSFVSVDDTGSFMPRIMFAPSTHGADESFELLAITPQIGEKLGVDPRLLPQGANRGDALEWLNMHHNLGDEMMSVATVVGEHGTVAESPLDKPMVELAGGLAALSPRPSTA